jgi:hypothetical protein
VHGLEAAAEHLLLVADNHAEAYAQAVGRLSGRGHAVCALGERRQRCGHCGRQDRALAVAPGGRGAEVVVHVLERRVEPLGSPEQRLGRLDRTELVEGHSGAVEHHGFGRVVLEHRQRLLGEQPEQAHRYRPRRVGRGLEAGREQGRARLVAALRRGERRGLLVQRPVGEHATMREVCRRAFGDVDAPHPQRVGGRD